MWNSIFFLNMIIFFSGMGWFPTQWWWKIAPNIFCSNRCSSHSGHQKNMPCRSSRIKLNKLSMSPVQTPLIDPLLQKRNWISRSRCWRSPKYTPVLFNFTPSSWSLTQKKPRKFLGSVLEGGKHARLVPPSPLLKSIHCKYGCAPEKNHLCMVV